MQLLLGIALVIGALAVLTDGQYSYRDFEELNHPVPIYPRAYGGVQGYDNYIDSASSYTNDEYQVKAKPVQLYVTYTRQGRGKKKGYGGQGWGQGGWWYYRDHKGCHSGTFGAPPGPGLEHEHYVNGACGSLGNHFKRVKGHGGGHGGGGHGGGHGGGGHGGGHGGAGHGGGGHGGGYGNRRHGGQGQGWGRPQQGWGRPGGYGHGKPYGGGLGGGYGGGLYRRGVVAGARARAFEYGPIYNYGY